MSELNLHGIAMASYEESNAFVSREAMVGKKIESLETSVEEVVESDSVQDQTLAEVEVVNEEQSSDIKGMEEMIASNEIKDAKTQTAILKLKYSMIWSTYHLNEFRCRF